MATPGSTFTANTYVPMLKCKQGELGALAGLAARDRVAPLLEVRDGGQQAQAIANAWPDPNHVLLVHPFNVDEHDDADWIAIVTDLFDGLRARGVAAVPVATTDDSPGVVAALASAVAQDGWGACLRLDAEVLALTPHATAASEIANLLGALGLGEADVDVVVDGGLLRDSLASRVTTVEAALNAVPNLPSWRNLIVGYSAFPESLSDVAAANAVTQLTRDDALAFATLLGRNPARIPVYGDYAVGVPFYADIPWAPIPAIRYASGDSWYVHRGYSKNNRSVQYVQLCTDVVGSGHYAGAAVSAGDAYLNDVATAAVGPGNPMTYVRAATSRHIACVSDRLATLGVP